jgi:CHASE1-domain containing sensor protein
VLGFDVGSERLRRQAIDAAVATGQPMATAPLTLVS